MTDDDKNQGFKLISNTIDGDEIYLNHDSIVVKFAGKKNGIVSSWLNGGYREDLSAVFNHQLSQENIDEYDDGGILGFLEKLSQYFYDELDLQNDKLSGLVTSAQIDKYSIAIERYKDIEVLAITTAGARVNAVSAGDVASYYELNGEYDFDLNSDDCDSNLNSDDCDSNLNSDDCDSNLNSNEINPNKPGTINTIILINSKLDESSLLLAEMVAVEAKAVALRDLMVSSNYSSEIATGTGTDGIAIFSNLESEGFIENVSKHAKIGEMIGKAVIRSVKDALAELQWLTPSYQLNALVRLDRFKMSLDEFYDEVVDANDEDEKKEFILSLIKVSRNPELVGYVSLIIHIIDQYRVGLLSEKAALKVSYSILDSHFNRDDWHSMKLLLRYVVGKQIV